MLPKLTPRAPYIPQRLCNLPNTCYLIWPVWMSLRWASWTWPGWASTAPTPCSATSPRRAWTAGRPVRHSAYTGSARNMAFSQHWKWNSLNMEKGILATKMAFSLHGKWHSCNVEKGILATWKMAISYHWKWHSWKMKKGTLAQREIWHSRYMENGIFATWK